LGTIATVAFYISDWLTSNRKQSEKQANSAMAAGGACIGNNQANIHTLHKKLADKEFLDCLVKSLNAFLLIQINKRGWLVF